MSDDLTLQIDAIALLIETALPTYSVDKTYTNPAKFVGSDYPKAMIFNPSFEIEKLTVRQTQTNRAIQILIVRKEGEAHQLRLDIQAIIDAAQIDQTLGGLVRLFDLVAGDNDEDLDQRVYGSLIAGTEKVKHGIS